MYEVRYYCDGGSCGFDFITDNLDDAIQRAKDLSNKYIHAWVVNLITGENC